MNDKRIKIDPEIAIVDLIEQYPVAADILQAEYEFHCVNCIFSEFDNLKEGAAIHGIEGAEFEGLLERLEEAINI